MPQEAQPPHEHDPTSSRGFSDSDLRTLASLGISGGDFVPGQRSLDDHEASEVDQDLPDHFSFDTLGDERESYIVDRRFPEASGAFVPAELDSRPDEMTVVVSRDTRFKEHPTILYTLISSNQSKNGRLMAYSACVTDGFADDTIELREPFQRLATAVFPVEIKVGDMLGDPQARESGPDETEPPYEIMGVYTVRPQMETDLSAFVSPANPVENFAFGFSEAHELYSKARG